MCQSIYDAYHVPYVIQPNGWVNTRCPFCGDNGMHLGCAPDSLIFNCWRCGRREAPATLSALLGVSEAEARRIAYSYRQGPRPKQHKVDRKVSIQPARLPTPNGPLTPRHKRYLAQRGYDPDKLAAHWGLLSAGPIAILEEINYANRILIPINWGGELATFQARDATDTSKVKYLASPQRREAHPIKTILYIDEEWWSRNTTCIIVEGVTDVWRLGPAAGATFGMDFKLEQVLAIPRHMERIWIMYDAEPLAQRRAQDLVVKLRMLGKQAMIHALPNGDPGSLPQTEADYLVKQLLS